MAPKRDPARQRRPGKGIQDKAIRLFEAGDLNISVESALSRVEQCPKFGRQGVCSPRCKKIHVRKGKLHISVGLYMACELERNPVSQPCLHVEPLLALQGYLLARRSTLVVDRLCMRNNAIVFKFAEQQISSVVKTIARQKFVNINNDGVVTKLHVSDEAEEPSLVLHAVKQDSVQSSLDILVNGFNYGETCEPFGICSVLATNEQQPGKIGFYEGGVSIVLKPTGFIVNVSEISADGNKRKNTNDWITGAPPGVVLFRRTPSQEHYIMHQDSVQFAYISIEQGLFESWALKYARDCPDDIKKAVLQRREWKASAGVVVPSPELSDRLDTAQTMASSSDPWPSRALAVAQPRLRPRSRSPTASEVQPEIGGRRGVEIPQPDVLLAPMSGLRNKRMTKTPEEKQRDKEACRHPQRSRAPEKHPVPSEMDRRYINNFVPPTIVYFHLENEKVREGAAASSGGPSSGSSSMLAARAVLKEDCPEAMVTVDQAQEPHWYYCAGPGCSTRKSGKKELKGHYYHRYCHQCYDRSNFIKTQTNISASSGSAEAMMTVDQAQEPHWWYDCDGPGCTTRKSSKKELEGFYGHRYCQQCHKDWNFQDGAWRARQ